MTIIYNTNSLTFSLKIISNSTAHQTINIAIPSQEYCSSTVDILLQYSTCVILLVQDDIQHKGLKSESLSSASPMQRI